ncbi:MAG: hypothetical protein RR785_08225, partial [Clostridium sp.]
MPDLKMTIIMPRNEAAKKNERLADVLEYAFYNKKHDVINTADELCDYLDAQDTGHLLLFVIELGNTGINMEYYRMLHFIREHENCLEGYIGGLVVDGDSDL